MARRFIESEEAAKMLSVTLETLNEMRERHEISAYRDGGRWKFKAEDIEKLKTERGAASPTDQAEPEFAELDDGMDSILLSEVELGQSSPSTSSTVIGKTNITSPESDIEIARPKQPAHGSDLASSMSDVRLASGSEVLKRGPDSSAKFDELDALDLDLAGPTGSGVVSGSSTKTAGPNPSLENDGLGLGEEPQTAKPASDHGAGGSALDLAGDRDDDLVFGSGSSGSDLTHAAGDSGISLVDPSDSGLSLEEAPMHLGGSAVESLDLSDDDMILLEEEGDKGASTQVKTDDDFLLTPVEDAGEESDSGSQVIALDSDVEFDDASTTMLGAHAPGAMLEEDAAAEFGLAAPSMGAALGPRADLGAVAGAQAVAPEAPYTVWNVVSLSLCVIFLMLGGMMMYDNLRNMWSWNGPYPVDSAIMNTILGWFG